MVTGSGVYRCRGLGVRARVGDSVSGPGEALVCGYESTVCLSALHVGVMFITGVFCHLNTEVHCFGPTPYSSSQILGITLWSVSKAWGPEFTP